MAGFFWGAPDNTYRCLATLLLFITVSPNRDRVAEAGKLIQDLRDRLETKSYENAKLYLNIGNNQSAVIAFNNTLRDFPDTKYAEELEYLIIKAQYEYAHQSRELKQEERYSQAITFADQFFEKYPASKFTADAKLLRKSSETGIVETKRVIAQADNDEKLARKLARKDSVFKQQRSVTPELNRKTP